MTTYSRIAGAMLVFVLVLVAFNVQAQKPAGGDRRAALSEIDAGIDKHARQMLEDGRRVFRFDTFGSEAFWGETLQLHRAIAGEKNGGVGGGVSPKTALSVGLKGGFYHDGRFATLRDLLEHYNSFFKLALTEQQKDELVEYLKSL